MNRSKMAVLATICVVCVFGIRLMLTSISLGESESARGQIAFDISPDSETIVFSALDGDLYSLNLKTQDVLRITSSKAMEITPRFRPDGTAIVYARETTESNGSSIFTTSLDGKEVRQLTRDPDVFDSSPAYSADGSKIVFARAHRHRPYSMGGYTWDKWDIYLMDSDGADLRRITKQEYYTLAAPNLSIDAESVIFSAVSANQGPSLSTLFEVSASGRKIPRFPPKDPPQGGRHFAWGMEPHLSPDGSQVAFISDRINSFHYDIFIMDRDGANCTPIGVTATVSRYNQYPVFAPDGKRILFLTGRTSGPGNRPVLSLWQVDTDGKNPQRIAGSRMLRTGSAKAATNDGPTE